MGVTTLVVEIANPAKPAVTQRLEFTVDSGAVYSVVPASLLRKLGIRSLKRETFRLAGDATLLGALTLEALGLSLDPIRRELQPMQLVL